MLKHNELIDIICNKFVKIVFLGAGGVSMSSLALIMKERGHVVAGYDRTESDTTRMLENAGIKMYYDFSEEMYKDAALVVYTGAIKREDKLCAYPIGLGIECVERPLFLGAIMQEKKNRIGVCGTHGKSTTTGMLTRIFDEAGRDPVSLNGAAMPEYGGNMRRGKGPDFIFEACEYRNSFLDFFPTTAVILNVEYDHADFFPDIEAVKKSFSAFADLADTAVVNFDCENARAALKNYKGKLIRTSTKDKTCEIFADNIECEEGSYSFDLYINGEKRERITLGAKGFHNVSNALCAIGAAVTSGVELHSVKKALSEFRGVARRFEFCGKTAEEADLYNDYAHHPDEIEATLKTASKVPHNGLYVIFQPHTYSRTKALFDSFTKAFRPADVVIFADIYPARETDSLGVSSKLLADSTENALYLNSDEKIIDFVNKNAKPGDIVIVMGAGDIDRLIPKLKK